MPEPFSDPAPAGRAALQAIAKKVNLPHAGSTPAQLHAALAASNLPAILLARHLCVLMLTASLNPSNCYSLLSLAADEAQPLPELRDAAWAACQSWPQPRAGDQRGAQGFAALSEELLTQLLTSDGLHVSGLPARACETPPPPSSMPMHRPSPRNP
jgi:hypothetical protein